MMACLQRFSRLRVLGYINITKSFYSTGCTVNKNTPIILTSIINKNPWIWQKQTNIETPTPLTNTYSIIDRSIIWIPPKSDPITSTTKSEIVDPLLEVNKYDKQAVKLIVIRRHKMRKHKLKKLRKRMKFEWAKRRQRREMRKEKLFQGELLAQIKEAEGFSAEKFVAEKIQKATEVPIPRFWKGKRLPEFIIREKLGLPPK